MHPVCQHTYLSATELSLPYTHSYSYLSIDRTGRIRCTCRITVANRPGRLSSFLCLVKAKAMPDLGATIYISIKPLIKYVPPPVPARENGRGLANDLSFSIQIRHSCRLRFFSFKSWLVPSRCIKRSISLDYQYVSAKSLVSRANTFL